jgi:hypothetical protein
MKGRVPAAPRCLRTGGSQHDVVDALIALDSVPLAPSHTVGVAPTLRVLVSRPDAPQTPPAALPTRRPSPRPTVAARQQDRCSASGLDSAIGHLLLSTGVPLRTT